MSETYHPVTSVAVPIRRIKTGKRALLPNGQPKPLPGTRSNKAGMIVQVEGQLGAPTHQQRATKLVPRDPTRQGLETQIQALRRSMEGNLKSIASLVGHGRMDKAALTAGIVATQRNRLIYLAEQAAAATRAEPVPAIDPIRTSRIKTKTKVKRYDTWSEK